MSWNTGVRYGWWPDADDDKEPGRGCSGKLSCAKMSGLHPEGIGATERGGSARSSNQTCVLESSPLLPSGAWRTERLKVGAQLEVRDNDAEDGRPPSTAVHAVHGHDRRREWMREKPGAFWRVDADVMWEGEGRAGVAPGCWQGDEWTAVPVTGQRMHEEAPDPGGGGLLEPDSI